MAKRPNILWLTSDQQRWDTIHALGNPNIDTPNLDKLCAQGVAFTRAYCQNPICTQPRKLFERPLSLIHQRQYQWRRQHPGAL